MYTIDPSRFIPRSGSDAAFFSTQAQALVAAGAHPASGGHFDELRGAAFEAGAAVQNAALAPAWASFFDALGAAGLGQLDQRMAQLKQQIHSNGITYNAYAQTKGVGAAQRPWALDLFPFLLTAADWQSIEAGVLQRARVLEGIMADVYGPQQLLKRALLPAALTQGHPGYLRAMHGAPPAGGCYLHIAAFDLARGPSGQWWVVSQRTQAPSGLGYLLENRAITSKLFPSAFAHAQVSPLAAAYQSLIHSMRQMSPAGAQAHIALLTPGPYSETYFEHAYLARHLGLSLVEGSDLTVRQQKLYLKTLHGLEPIHGLLKRLDDAFLDPLELRSDSSLGVPGLLQCIRSGNVLMANAPGSAFLESPALLGFMPGIAQQLLGQPLSLPALPTWWCGERSALDAVLPRLQNSVVKPSYPAQAQQEDFEAMLGKYMGADQRDALAGRMLRTGNAYTVQSYLPMSQMPTWQAGAVVPKSAMLRVFALSDGQQGWQVLPGGLMRIASGSHEVASMRSGGSSADVWLTGTVMGANLGTAQQPMPSHAPPQPTGKRVVTSRSAEHMFWLGRYSERTECALQTAQQILAFLQSPEASHAAMNQPTDMQDGAPMHAAHAAQGAYDLPAASDAPKVGMRHWLGVLAVQNALVLPSVPSLVQSPRVFERSLLAALGDTQNNYSVAYNFRALKNAAFTVRERLSQEQWDLIEKSEQYFAVHSLRCLDSESNPHNSQAKGSALAMQHLLSKANVAMAAITGAQTDRMARDDGWRMLSIGRLVERLQFLAASLLAGLTQSTLGFSPAVQASASHQAGYSAMLSLLGSSSTFHATHHGRHDMAALIEFLVLDRDNPRSLGWVAKTLRGRLAKLEGDAPQEQCALSRLVPDAKTWLLHALLECDPQWQPQALLALLQACTTAASQVAQAIGTQYFTHAQVREKSVGA